MTAKKSRKLFKAKVIRWRNLARLMFLNPGWTYQQLGDESGYSRRQVIYITRQEAFRSHLLHLQDMADAKAVGLRTRIDQAAMKAVEILTQTVTPGTKLYKAATTRQRIIAAIDLIDRSRMAPKIKVRAVSQTSIIKSQSMPNINEFLRELAQSGNS